MAQERRRHARTAPDAGYFLTCTASGVLSPSNLSTRLLDVGPQGACVLTTGRLREDVALDLCIVLPGFLSRFRARAVVRWSKTVRSPDGFREAHVAGLRFERFEETGGRAADFLGAETRDAARSEEPRRRDKRFRPGRADISVRTRFLWREREAALRLHDLSLGGAQVVCSRRLEPGRNVRFAIDVTRPRSTVAGEALVRWCRRDTLRLEPLWHAGLLFKGLDAASESALRGLDRAFLGC
jgi:hypothetical protein